MPKINNAIYNRRVLQVLVIIVLAFSSLTFTVAREVFDPHVGIDYDIFCKSFDSLSTDNSVAIILISKDTYQSNFFFYITPIHSLYDSRIFIIRGPPAAV